MRSLANRVLPLLTLCGLLGSASAAVAAGAAAGPETLATSTGAITVEGTSSLHAWTVVAKDLRGSLVLPAGFLEGGADAVPTASFTLAVTALRSEHDRMNRIMWESLLAAKHPDLIFTLQTASLNGNQPGAVKVEITGLLTVAGTARPVTLSLSVRRDGQRLLASGQLPLKMTDFGIKPPTAMLGTVRTGDSVLVKIEATLAPVP